MKITPVTSPIIQSPPSGASAARDKAIAMLSGKAPEVNQNSVAPEEAKAVKPEANLGLDVNSVEASSPESEEPAEQPAEETKVEEAKEPEEGDKKLLSSQYAILARKEKALRAKEQSLKVKEEAMKLASATPTRSESPSKPSIEERLKSDPISVLNELGITYDQLTNGELNKPSPQDQMIAKLEAKIAALEEGSNKVNQRFEEQQTQSYQQAIKAIEHEATQLVKMDPSFETIKETGSIQDVVDLIEETFKKDGILLSVEEAAKEVEDHLVEEAMKITRIKKIQQRLAQASKPAVPQQKPESKQPALKTLTNAISGSRQLSARERAILAAEGKLNK